MLNINKDNLNIYINNQDNFIEDKLSVYLNKKRADKKVSKFTLKFKIIISFIIIIILQISTNLLINSTF